MGAQHDGEEHADVLIVTAVKDEGDAVFAVDTRAKTGSAWEKRTGATGLKVAFREFTTEGGGLRGAVTQALGMDGTNAVVTSAHLRGGGTPSPRPTPPALHFLVHPR